ncbi:MAG: DUF2786 domain-containing protein [Rhodoblastus sp.]
MATGEKERLIAKIKALRAKTRAAGATEAEALAAAAKAAELMREHKIGAEDLEFVEERRKQKESRPTWRTPLTSVIAYVTNCGAIVIHEGSCASLVFVGREPGPQIAGYLRDVCFRAVERAQRAFKTSAFYSRRRGLGSKRAAVQDFTDAMVSRLCVRLLELFADVRDDAARAAARALVNVRWPGNEVIHRPDRKERHSEAGWEGWKAGGDVSLNRGVGAAAGPALIGGA